MLLELNICNNSISINLKCCPDNFQRTGSGALSIYRIIEQHYHHFDNVEKYQISKKALYVCPVGTETSHEKISSVNNRWINKTSLSEYLHNSREAERKGRKRQKTAEGKVSEIFLIPCKTSKTKVINNSDFVRKRTICFSKYFWKFLPKIPNFDFEPFYAKFN